MSFKISIKDSIFFVVAEGRFSLEECLDIITETLDEYGSAQKLKILIYDNHSSFDGSAEEMKKILRVFSQNKAKLTRQIAVVATGLLQFGLANMFSVYGSLSEWKIKTFRDYNKGLDWLTGLE